MLMCFVYGMNVHKKGRSKFSAIFMRDGPTLSWFKQGDIEVDLLLCLTNDGLVRVLIKLNMASRRAPHAVFVVLSDKHFILVDDIDIHCEINFFVNVRHIEPVGIRLSRKWAFGTALGGI